MSKEEKEDKDVFFNVREKQSEIKFLDMAINILGYKDRAEWYRDMKRNTIAKAKLLPLMIKEYAMEDVENLKNYTKEDEKGKGDK